MKQAFLNRIKHLPKFGDGICLARMETAITRLNLRSFLQNTPNVAITGTNGKGSVATLLHDILTEAGYNSALFTSPHFFEFNERFRLKGENVSYDRLNQAFDDVYHQVRTLEQHTQECFGIFEILFLVALKTFEQLGADFLIFEAGIGGRYDPVRLMRSKLTALTSVDLEHSDILGNTKELIAYDKLDACQNGGTSIIGNIDRALQLKVEAYCALRHITTVHNEQITIDEKADGAFNITLADAQSFTCQTQLFGKFAMENIKTALCLAEMVLQDEKDKITAYQHALARHTHPGRLSVIHESPRVLVDSAHTDESYRLLFASLQQRYQKQAPVFLVGISQGRKQDELIKGLIQLANRCVVSQAKFKGADALQLAEKLEQAGVKCQVNAHLPQAVKQALSLAESLSVDLIVCGGLFFAGEVNAIISEQGEDALFLY